MNLFALSLKLGKNLTLSQSFRRIYALFVARNLEYFRDRAAFFWGIGFPVLVIIGFAFAFSDGDTRLYKVGVLDLEASSERQFALQSAQYTNFVDIADLAAGIVKVERHGIDLLIDTESRRYWVNESSPKGYVLEHMLRSLNGGVAQYQRIAVDGAAVRYVDWVLPGVLAMNMMFTALWGIGFVIVRYRKNGVLKRLRATPVNAVEFLLAQLLSRIWIIVGVNALIFVLLDQLVDFRMYGSYWDLLLVFTVGSLSLCSLGLIVAARIYNEELASGLLNFFSWPMMFLSEVWFSLEGAHPLILQLAQLLPLTHLIDAMRAIMIDGASLWEVSPQLLVLTALSVLFLAAGAKLFRWE